MNVVFDGTVYEDVASAVQCVLIHNLNQALKENGIDDKDRRRAICEKYIFETSELLDQLWIKTKETKQKLHPRICLTDRQLEEDAEADADAKIFLPADGFEFHSYSYGTIEYYFDDCKEKLKDVKVGS